METEKWVFIVNPVAGGGFSRKYVPVIEDMVKKHQLSASVVYTEYSGHATVLAASYADQGYRYIIGVGGDGTMNEIGRALAGNKTVITGLVPAGTGNDFIQILGFPDRFTAADWDTFFKRDSIAMDVGECNQKLFLNGMGLGFDAQVASENYDEQGRVKPGGKNKYIWHILKNLFFYREEEVVIHAGLGEQKGNCFIHTIGNGRRFAGGFFLTPQALANDGLLDVCMIRKIGLLQRLRILLMVPKGSHIGNKKVHYYRSSVLKLEFQKRVPYHVDGELFFDTTMEVSIQPSSLQIIYNKEGNHYFSVKN